MNSGQGGLGWIGSWRNVPFVMAISLVGLCNIGFSQDREPSASQAATEADTEIEGPAREVIYQRLATLRSNQGLRTLRRDPRLERAAQKQVEDSVREGYFGFASPKDGRRIEDWVEAEGYQTGQVAEKLAEANLRVAEIVESWGEDVERNSSSILSPLMMDVGVGVAQLGSRNRIIVVVGTTDNDLVRRRVSRLMDADQVEADFLVHLNALRDQAGLKPMVQHKALRSAATQLAEEILAFELEPDARRRSYAMVRRIRQAGYRMREAVELQAIGPTSVEELVEFWFKDADSQAVLLRRFFSEFGLAVMAGETADGPTVIWVLAMGRPGRY